MLYPSDGLRVVERCRKGGCAAWSGPAIAKSGQAAAIDDAALSGRRSSYTRLPAPDARPLASFAAVQRVDDLLGGSPAVRTNADLLATPRYATADDE